MIGGRREEGREGEMREGRRERGKKGGREGGKEGGREGKAYYLLFLGQMPSEVFISVFQEKSGTGRVRHEPSLGIVQPHPTPDGIALQGRKEGGKEGGREGRKEGGTPV